MVGQQLRIVEDGQAFDPPRKPGKLVLDGEKPKFGKPRFDKPKFGKPGFDKSKPGKAPSHAFPPRKPHAKAGAVKGKTGPKTK